MPRTRTNPRFRLAVALLCLLLASCSRFRQYPPDPVTIHWESNHQIIDGFGASVTGYTDGFTEEFADQFFNRDTGLGLSILRLHVIAGRENEPCRCVSNSSPYQCAQGADSEILTGDLQVAQLAAKRGVRFVAAPWSPPAEMKTSGEYCSVGAMKGGDANYKKYSAQLADTASLLRDKGVNLDALSPQNEPDMENSRYDTCRWTPQQLHDFVPVLSDALRSRGLDSVKIAAPEQSTWSFEYLAPLLGDPAVADRIGFVFGHGYESVTPSGLPQAGSRHVWQTEASEPSRYDGSMTDALHWAQSIHNYMTIGANAWLYWSLACGPRHFNQRNNMCLTDKDERLAKRAFVLGQFAKFVRPGWQRVALTNNSVLLVTAYRGPKNEFAIVAVNPAPSAVTQKFEWNGFSATQVVPWLTDRSSSLQEQSPVAAGTSFTYRLPAESVVTFQGKGE